MENHSSPEKKHMSRNLCENQHWGRKTQTVIELLEAQCGSVWDLKTPAGSRLKRDLTPFWILSSGALPGSQSKDWREKKITSGFQQQEEESSRLEICTKHSMLLKTVALKNIIFLEANLLWFYQSLTNLGEGKLSKPSPFQPSCPSKEGATEVPVKVTAQDTNSLKGWDPIVGLLASPAPYYHVTKDLFAEVPFPWYIKSGHQ